jgi:hypothetical protein
MNASFEIIRESLKQCPKSHPLIPVSGRIYDFLKGYKPAY